MIVFKITYDTSVVADFAPTFNSGFTYTTKTSTSGTLKTVTYESDTVFTAISIPNNNRNCVKSIYIDASGMTNLYGTFTSCQSMTDFTIVNATSKLTNLYQTTYDCTVLSNITYQDCDLSGVTNIQNVFNNGARDVVTNATFKNVKFNDTTKSMISILGKATTMVVEDCDFSSITSCYNLFGGCGGLKGTLDLSTYDFTNVYETNNMFNKCTNLTKIIMPKGTFDKITNCGAMFQNCTSLVEVDLSGFHIPNAQNISYMFGGCTSIEEIDCSALGVLNPTNINHMFVSCQKLKRVNLSGIKAPKAISFSHMFYESAVVEWIDISNVLARASNEQNFWRSGTVVKNIGMLYCPADVINYFTNTMVSSGRTCNIYYHDAKLEDLTVDSRFNYIYCEEYHGDVVSTPDDLKLYGLSDVKDVLDLTNGLVTRKIGKLTNCHELISAHSYSEDGGYYTARLRWGGVQNIKTNGNQTLVLCNVLRNGSYKPNTIWSHGVDGAYYLHFGDCTTLEEAQQYCLDNNLTILYELKEPTTEQISIPLNSLKSYYNGSIQTSSQQLTPTLKTTLPISNKFTTTNLTSGSTYNVYFDGTATKLDAGGTIITNPVSPCEVECGGTTLTIEGTDIQNVRVIETTVSNEVGSVYGTTDVELSGVKCIGGGIPNLLSTLSTDWENGTDYGVCIRYKYGIDVEPNEKYVFTISKIAYDNGYKEIAIWNTDTWVSNTESIITTQRLTPNTPYIFTVPSGVTKVYIYFPYDSSGNLNQAHEYELRMQEGTVDLGYGGQKEATIPLVCNLEQPIKLRSLGATYDSYNPIAGELTKRIGVSETDGSYSVLSSPIVSQVMKVETLTNVFPYLTDVVGDTTKIVLNSATYDEDNWVYFHNKKGSHQAINYLDMSNFKPNTYYTWFVEVKNNTLDEGLSLSMESGTSVFDNATIPVGFNGLLILKKKTKADFTKIQRSFMIQKWYTVGGTIDFRITIVEGDYTRTTVPHFIGTQNVVFPINQPETPQLYTNGQVKVYSDSEVYPTTILNGQSTNNYEINGLNTSNNYTIRYDGECESINLAKKSNTQGTNRIVKAGATSGNLTFVNDSGDIDNVLLVQSDVREQEINHFTGLQTVEVSAIKINETMINLPQPVQLNSLPDGTCDTYNPITGEYVQNVGVAIWSDIKYISREAVSKDKKWASYWLKLNGEPGGNGYSALHTIQNSEIPVFPNIPDINQIPYVHIGSRTNTGGISLRIPVAEEGVVDNRGTGVIQWLKDNDIHMYYKLDTKITTPITTQLTPINIPTFEGGIVQLITTDGKVFPMIEYSMPTNNRYDTSSWEIGAVYTQRNMTEAYFNESTTPMTPTETMTLTTDHISSGSIILNDNGNGLVVLKGNYTGRDIPYFTGMRSVEAIEVEVNGLGSPDGMIFGKGGRK